MERVWHKFYPEGVPYEIETPNWSMYEILERTEKQYPTKFSIIDGDRSVTYSELKCYTDNLAYSLHRRGFKKGDRLALMLNNSMEYLITFYAVHRLGGIVVQVNPMYQTHDLEYILRDSDATWFIGLQKEEEKLKKIGFRETLTTIFVGKQRTKLFSCIN